MSTVIRWSQAGAQFVGGTEGEGSSAKDKDAETVKSAADRKAADADACSKDAKTATAETADNARRMMAADLRAQQAYRVLQALVPTAAAETAQTPRLSLSQENGETVLEVEGTDANDEISIDGSGDAWDIKALRNGEMVSLGRIPKSLVDKLRVKGGGGDDALVGLALDGRVTLDGGKGNDTLISLGLDGAESALKPEQKGKKASAGPVLSEGEGNGGVYNEVAGAVIDAGAGCNAVLNRGAGVSIGQLASIESSDFVINEGANALIDFENAGAHEIHQLGDDGVIAAAGPDAFLSVSGRRNAAVLGGQRATAALGGEDNALLLSGRDALALDVGLRNEVGTSAEKPAEPAKKPAEPSKKSAELAQKPADLSQKPAAALARPAGS